MISTLDNLSIGRISALMPGAFTSSTPELDTAVFKLAKWLERTARQKVHIAFSPNREMATVVVVVAEGVGLGARQPRKAGKIYYLAFADGEHLIQPASASIKSYSGRWSCECREFKSLTAATKWFKANINVAMIRSSK